MNELVFIPIIVVLLLAYNLWRRSAALNAREKMADELESFLGSSASEDHKEMTYSLFSICTDPYLMVFVTYYVVFQKDSNKKKAKREALALPQSLPEISDTQRKQCKNIINMGATIILKRAPITTLSCTLVIILVSSFRILINKLTVGESVEQLEDGIEKVAHRGLEVGNRELKL
ncbi:hypothetical protein EU508_08295 [Pseudoalteromonas fuliginea]|uniref:Uncharacterized protein n=1 Tax=Pseudoalteromonas fuliginea TaxID=1872678 RepID=A0AB73BHV2_9GAMM|nr:hypothetical protein [Pseudoalteromonas fuliginea]KAA1161004.1 hypothetical protein EU508_08295 [Pseudoalteromonas fuliginea]